MAIILFIAGCSGTGSDNPPSAETAADMMGSVPDLVVDCTSGTPGASSLTTSDVSEFQADLASAASGFQESDLPDLADINSYLKVINFVRGYLRTYLADNQPPPEVAVRIGATATASWGQPIGFDSLEYFFSDASGALEFYLSFSVDTDDPFDGIPDYPIYLRGKIESINGSGAPYKTTIAFNPQTGLDLVYIEHFGNSGRIIAYEEYEDSYYKDGSDDALIYNYRLYEPAGSAGEADFRSMHLEEPAVGGTFPSDGKTEFYWLSGVRSRAGQGAEIYYERMDNTGEDVYLRMNSDNSDVDTGSLGALTAGSGEFQSLISGWEATARSAIASYKSQSLLDLGDSIWDDL
jgi:hypothetical protein